MLVPTESDNFSIFLLSLLPPGDISDIDSFVQASSAVSNKPPDENYTDCTQVKLSLSNHLVDNINKTIRKQQHGPNLDEVSGVLGAFHSPMSTMASSPRSTLSAASRTQVGHGIAHTCSHPTTDQAQHIFNGASPSSQVSSPNGSQCSGEGVGISPSAISPIEFSAELLATQPKMIEELGTTIGEDYNMAQPNVPGRRLRPRRGGRSPPIETSAPITDNPASNGKRREREDDDEEDIALSAVATKRRKTLQGSRGMGATGLAQAQSMPMARYKANKEAKVGRYEIDEDWEAGTTSRPLRKSVRITIQEHLPNRGPALSTSTLQPKRAKAETSNSPHRPHCRFDGECEATFSRTYDRDRHEVVHLNEAQYLCRLCGRGFNRSDVRIRHERRCKAALTRNRISKKLRRRK